MKKPTQASRRPSASTLLRWGGSLLSTPLFIWLIARQKWEVVFDKATGLAPWAVALALVFYLGSFGFNTLRWCILLWAQQAKISFWRAYRISWAGNFASNFLPSTIGGDGFRMLAVHPFTASKTISVGSVALDRLINMSAMACLLPAPALIFGSSLLQLLGLSQPTASLFFGIKLPSALQKLIQKFIPKIGAAFQLWAAKPGAFALAFLAAWPSNMLPISATYLLARQLDMQVSFWQVLAIQTVTYFLSVLPISVNGYGVREVAFTSLYASLGASLEQASTLALVTRFLNVMATLPGAIWLSASLKDIARSEKEPEATEPAP